MTTNHQRVTEFHRTFDVPVSLKPQLLDPDRQELRIELITEEFSEYLEAIEAGDLVNAAKELADILYVVYGTAVEHGFDMDKVLEAVHTSNMSKREPCDACDQSPISFRMYLNTHCEKCHNTGLYVKRNAMGKVLKGSGYAPPDIAKVLGVDRTPAV